MLNFFRYHGTKLNVKELDFEGVVADKIAALLDVLAHQDTEQPVRLARVIEFDVQQRPLDALDQTDLYWFWFEIRPNFRRALQ